MSENLRILIEFGLYTLQSAAFLCLSFAMWWVYCDTTFRKWHWPKQQVRDMMFWWTVFGLIGGRLIVVLEHLELFVSAPQLILNFYRYGISVFGIICGSAIYLILSSRKMPFSKVRAEDVMISNLPLALALFNLLYILFNYQYFTRSDLASRGMYGIGCIVIWLIVHYWFLPKKYSHKGEGALAAIFLIGVLQLLCLLFNKFVIGSQVDTLPEIFNALILIAAGLLSRIPLVQEQRKLMGQKPILLFDLDGTLVDSQPLVFETFRQVFARLKPDYTLSEDELYSFFGPTLETTFSKYFPADEVEDVIDVYQEINLALHDGMIEPMPYAQDVLKELKEQGYEIGIVSNKRKKVVHKGLKACGLEDYVDVVMGKEDQPKAKPEPDGLIAAVEAMGGRLDNVIYVGDNAADIRAAKNMAACSIGYSNDERQRQALRQANPCWNIMDLREILEIVKEDQEWIDKSIW